tara:strand:+ start:44299 stop:45588 length:1290 start_codon:yes stop_codon:yes gene_type:complete
LEKKKKILIITYYWPPSGGAGVQRWVKFCKYLPDFGYEPIVLTVENGTYPLTDTSLLDQIPADTKVYRSKSIEPYSLFGKITGKSSEEVSTPATAFTTEKESLLKKIGVWIRANLFIPDARIGWIPDTLKKAKELLTSYDIDTFITTGPPNSTHVTGTKLKESFPEAKWIMDMRDPWSKIFFNETLPRSFPASWFDEYLEKKALSLADEVIVVSKNMADLERTIFERSYQIIPNGFDHEDFRVSGREKSEKFSIKYVGSMTEAAIPYAFFHAVSKLSPVLKSKLEIHFYGSFNDKVKQMISKYGLSDLVSFHGYIPHLEAKNEMQSADLLLLVIPQTTNNELILTGKLFDYIGSQSPILYIGPIPGDAADIIKEAQVGHCFEYTDETGITDFLEESISKNKVEYSAWEKDFKDHPYSRYSLTKHLSNLL